MFVICECKKHRNPIKRSLVQVLHSTKTSLAANKAILIATAPFQSGAIAFAEKHKIALIQIHNGVAAYITNSTYGSPFVPPDPEPYVGMLNAGLDDQCMYPSLIASKRMNIGLKRFLYFDIFDTRRHDDGDRATEQTDAVEP